MTTPDDNPLEMPFDRAVRQTYDSVYQVRDKGDAAIALAMLAQAIATNEQANALSSQADALERIAEALEKIAQEKGIIYIRNVTDK